MVNDILQTAVYTEIDEIGLDAQDSQAQSPISVEIGLFEPENPSSDPLSQAASQFTPTPRPRSQNLALSLSQSDYYTTAGKNHLIN